MLTFLRESMPLVCLETLLTILLLHRSIGPALCERELHLLSKQLEVLKQLQCLGCLIHAVEYYESLPFGLDILLGDDIDDGASIGESVAEFLDEFGNLDLLVEIAGLCA